MRLTRRVLAPGAGTLLFVLAPGAGTLLFALAGAGPPGSEGSASFACTNAPSAITMAAMSVAKQRAIAVGVGVATAIAISLVHEQPVTGIFQGIMIGLAGFSLTEMRKLRDLGGRDFRQHGIATAGWHLATTNLVAVAYAWFMFDGYRSGPTPEATFKAFGSAAKDWMLASGLVGATLGLFRSTGTSSAALQALKQNQELLAEVTSLRRTFVDATDLTTMALDASQASSLEDLIETVEAMVTIASDLPEKSELVDAFTVWIKDDDKKAWRILSGRGVSAKTIASFEQPVLERVTKGKGIVANLDASGQKQLVLSSKAGAHEWYADDPYTVRKTEGLAAVLLLDKRGKPCGALCLTSEDPRGIPSVEDTLELQRFEKVLQLWAGTFTLPVQRYFELIEAPPDKD